MQFNYNAALAAVLIHEGGYVDNPHDLGGATNQGVTQVVYDAYRDHHGLPRQSVRNITRLEVDAIYRMQYWDLVRGDSLPSGLDNCIFDFSVNSGTARAAKFLQRRVGVEDDGHIGLLTLSAIAALPVPDLINGVCDDRVAFLKGRSNYAYYGHGWLERVAEVRKMSLKLWGG